MKSDNVDYTIMADTDSAYFNVTLLVEKMFPKGADDDTIHEFLLKVSNKIKEEAIQVALNELYDRCNVFERALDMKLEAIGSAAVRASKNYIMSLMSLEGIRYKEPKIKMVGIEAVKSSTPEVCRKFIKESIPYIMSFDRDGLLSHIESSRKSYFDMEFHEIAKPSSVLDITKWQEDGYKYKKGTPYHVKASIAYNKMHNDHKIPETEYQKIQDGDKIRISHMKKPNPFGGKYFACPDSLPSEFKLDDYIDYETMFNKLCYSPIKSLSDVAKIDLSNKTDINDFY